MKNVYDVPSLPRMESTRNNSSSVNSSVDVRFKNVSYQRIHCCHCPVGNTDREENES